MRHPNTFKGLALLNVYMKKEGRKRKEENRAEDERERERDEHKTTTDNRKEDACKEEEATDKRDKDKCEKEEACTHHLSKATRTLK